MEGGGLNEGGAGSGAHLEEEAMRWSAGMGNHVLVLAFLYLNSAGTYLCVRDRDRGLREIESFLLTLLLVNKAEDDSEQSKLRAIITDKSTIKWNDIGTTSTRMV